MLADNIIMFAKDHVQKYNYVVLFHVCNNNNNNNTTTTNNKVTHGGAGTKPSMSMLSTVSTMTLKNS